MEHNAFSMVKQQSCISLAVLCTALLIIGAIRWVNGPPTECYYGDFLYYYNMAEFGLFDSPNLDAPYAYRYLTPLIVRLITIASGTYTKLGFVILVYIGTFMQLIGIFWLSRMFGFGKRTAFINLLLLAGSLANVKFILFDPYRPETLAYPMMILAIYLMIHKPFYLLTVATFIGIQIREFLIVPYLIGLIVEIRRWFWVRSRGQIMVMIGSMVLIIATILIPRLCFPIGHDQQWVDPFHKSDTVKRPLEAPVNMHRNMNYLFSLFGFLLPSILLYILHPLHRIWGEIWNRHRWFYAYTGMILISAFYGGTDFPRFMSYLFIPQALLVGYLIQEDITIVKILFVFAAVITFNRLYLPFPIWNADEYIGFYGGYDDVINSLIIHRYHELASWIGSAVILRWIEKNFCHHLDSRR